jgi:hypothetical protein
MSEQIFASTSTMDHQDSQDEAAAAQPAVILDSCSSYPYGCSSCLLERLIKILHDSNCKKPSFLVVTHYKQQEYN